MAGYLERLLNMSAAVCLLLLAGCLEDGGTAPVDDLRIAADMAVSFPKHCTDGMKDDDESDVDCGGDTCRKCIGGQSCLHGSDCDSTICDNNTCTVPLCDDGKANGSETDLDCGGACPPCAIGKGCIMSADCDS